LQIGLGIKLEILGSIDR